MFEFIFILFGASFIFWPLLIINIGFLFLFTEKGNTSGTIWAMLFGIFLGIIKFGSFGAFWLLVKSNPFVVFFILILYLFFGVCWAFFKWYLLVNRKAELYKAEIEKDGWDTVAKRYSNSYQSAFRDKRASYSYPVLLEKGLPGLAPLASLRKEKIISWIITWPPSVILLVLDDPIKKTVDNIFESIKGTFQTISNRAFRG